MSVCESMLAVVEPRMTSMRDHSSRPTLTQARTRLMNSRIALRSCTGKEREALI